ncbi:MAG: Lrp/AsnC family transcriptional regulator [DPANN group archaeon]|nr:Lrp/AsnC family transcriptional regulator [DPANN group archaeon]
MIQQKLGLDDRDVKILTWMMENPGISQADIAERLKVSQPSVNARIQKLTRTGMLNHHVGLSFTNSGLFLARVDLTASNPNMFLEKMRKCSFFVNGFIMSGKNNVSVFLVSEGLKKIDEIITNHIRSEEGVSDINVNVVVSASNDFLFKLNLVSEVQRNNCLNPESCANCNVVHPSAASTARIK